MGASGPDRLTQTQLCGYDNCRHKTYQETRRGPEIHGSDDLSFATNHFPAERSSLISLARERKSAQKKAKERKSSRGNKQGSPKKPRVGGSGFLHENDVPTAVCDRQSQHFGKIRIFQGFCTMPILMILIDPTFCSTPRFDDPQNNPYDFPKTALWQNARFPRVLHDAHFW